MVAGLPGNARRDMRRALSGQISIRNLEPELVDKIARAFSREVRPLELQQQRKVLDRLAAHPHPSPPEPLIPLACLDEGYDPVKAWVEPGQIGVRPRFVGFKGDAIGRFLCFYCHRVALP